MFRGWRAALVPLAGALVTVAGALLLLLAATEFIDVASYAVDVIALFGLALAVDYSLLIVSRFREERADGTDVPTAVERTVTTAGRTLVFSAMTVIAALAGLFAFGEATFTSLAVGGIATVLVALAAGLTLVPALTATWGHRIAASSPTDATAQPAQRRLTDTTGSSGGSPGPSAADRSRSRSPSPPCCSPPARPSSASRSPTATTGCCPPRRRAGRPPTP